jgi:hypothetical protein
MISFICEEARIGEQQITQYIKPWIHFILYFGGKLTRQTNMNRGAAEADTGFYRSASTPYLPHQYYILVLCYRLVHN